MNITNNQALNLYKNLALLRRLEGDKFAYKIIYNRRQLKLLYDVYQEMLEPEEKYLQYNQEREDLCVIYGDKDENEQPIFQGKQYKITKQKREFDAEMVKLDKKYKKQIQHRKSTLENAKNFLSDTAEVELLTISQRDLPKNISVEEMDVVFDLITK